MDELLLRGELAVYAAIAFLGVLALLTIAIAVVHSHHTRRRQERLDRAFQRAQRYRDRGTVCEDKAFALGIVPARHIHS